MYVCRFAALGNAARVVLQRARQVVFECLVDRFFTNRVKLHPLTLRVSKPARANAARHHHLTVLDGSEVHSRPAAVPVMMVVVVVMVMMMMMVVVVVIVGVVFFGAHLTRHFPPVLYGYDNHLGRLPKAVA